MKYLVFLFFCGSLAFALPSKNIRGDPAASCIADNCKIENNCRCSSSKSPLAEGTAPQLISLTFDESVVKDGYEAYWKPLLYSRVNPDNEPIGATFFVPHDYTDYELVNDLYLSGFEIGVHSVTKNNLQEYWRTASLDTLIQEFGGQKEILSIYANIPADDIQGVRTPQLQIQGNITVQAYLASKLSYDSSWPTLPNKPLYPYTLDYASTQECTATVSCPNEPYNGFWVLPINDLQGADKECNTLASCGINGTAQEIATWLSAEIERVRTSSKVPITLLVNSYWFNFTDNSFDALNLVLDDLQSKPDVFLVTQKQVLDWVKAPVPLEEFKTEFPDRSADCTPITCTLKTVKGETRYMRSCVACPKVYPWLGNPQGNQT